MAEENSKLYITISDSRGKGGKGTPTKKDEEEKINQEEEEQGNSLIGRYAEHELFHIVKKNITQAVNYSLSNVGNFTGDYITQRKVNENKQFVSGVVNLGMSAFAGFKSTGGSWVGAAIGFVVGASSLVAESVYDNITTRAEYSKQNYNITQLRNKVGLNAIYDGSRGTEN